MLSPPDAAPPYRLMATLPQPGPYRSRDGDPRARPATSTIPSRRPISRRRASASATTAGRRRSASTASSDDEWIRHFGRFEPLPDNLAEPLALRYHGHQFRVYNPDIGDGRGFLFAQLRDARRPPARSRHQGLGPDPLQPLRRRPADAEGRGARAARHRDARGARRRDLEDLLADRDRRGAGAQRRALADPLRGAGPAPAQPYPHRHLPAPRDARRDGQSRASSTDYCLRHYYADDSGDPARLLDHVAGATARLAASYIAAGFVHGVLNSDNIAITARELRLRPLALHAFLGRPFHRRLFRPCRPLCVRPPARGDPLGPGPARPLAHRDRRGRGADRRRSKPSPAASRARCATRCSPGSASVPRDLAEDMKLVAAIEEALAEADGDDRPLLLRLARRPARSRTAMTGLRRGRAR